MRVRLPLCPESEDIEEKEEQDRIRDPHGENLEWAKRARLENESGVKATSV
jgi:hypothetical protein